MAFRKIGDASSLGTVACDSKPDLNVKTGIPMSPEEIARIAKKLGLPEVTTLEDLQRLQSIDPATK